MLFAPGERPDIARLAQAVDQIAGIALTFTPPELEGDMAGPVAGWAELLVGGLAFDCLGLAPSPPIDPASLHNVMILTPDELARSEGIGLMPGPHLAAARNALPVLRALTRLASDLGSALGNVSAFAWGPAHFAVGPDIFRRLVDDWCDGGPFPALFFVGVVEGDAGEIRSEGLAFLTGQEIMLAPSLELGRIEGAQLIARLVDELVRCEPLSRSVQRQGDDGCRLSLEPASDGAIIRVMKR